MARLFNGKMRASDSPRRHHVGILLSLIDMSELLILSRIKVEKYR